MKIIDLDNSAFEAMTAAPIDERNVCSDFLLDDIYDNQHYVENGKRSVGFVNGYPTLIDYGGYSMNICFNLPFSIADEYKWEWAHEIVERLTGINMPFDKSHIYVLDEDTELIYRIICFNDMLVIAFKYYQQ